MADREFMVEGVQVQDTETGEEFLAEGVSAVISSGGAPPATFDGKSTILAGGVF